MLDTSHHQDFKGHLSASLTSFSVRKEVSGKSTEWSPFLQSSMGSFVHVLTENILHQMV